MPLRSDLQQAKDALEEQPAELVQVSLSPQQQYLLLLVHQAAESAVLEVLRPFGFAAASFGTLTGTVQENLHRLDDEEMIACYAGLAHSLGGWAQACYLSGYAVKTPEKVFVYQERMEDRTRDLFWLTDTPCVERHPGWPLDSLSYYSDRKTSFLSPKPPVLSGPEDDREWKRLLAFLKESLGLSSRSE